MSNAYVVRPLCTRFKRQGELVALLAFVPAHDVTQEQIDSFRSQHCSNEPSPNRKDSDTDRWIVFERSVTVVTADGLRRHAAKLVAEMQDHFGLTEISIH